MAKLNPQLTAQEITPANQTAVTEAPTASTSTPPANQVANTTADENVFAKNKNVIIVGVVLVLGYLLLKNKMK